MTEQSQAPMMHAMRKHGGRVHHCCLRLFHNTLQQEGRLFHEKEVRALSEQFNSEQFQLNFAQRGVSQTSQGGLERGVHTPAVSWVVSIYLSRSILPSNTTLCHRLMSWHLSLTPVQETPDITPTHYVGLLSLFASDLPHYVLLGKSHTEDSVCVARGASHTLVQRHTLAWNLCRRLSRARAIKTFFTGVFRRGKLVMLFLSTSSKALKRRVANQIFFDASIF